MLDLFQFQVVSNSKYSDDLSSYAFVIMILF